MPTSAVGNNPRLHWRQGSDQRPRAQGFTLIELMVVVALMGLATAGVGLALRDSADSALERDAQRLAAVLEATRAQARASDVRAVWLPHAVGFVVQGLPGPAQPQAWLSAHTQAQITNAIVLGPEPLIGPQQITLLNTQQPRHRLQVRTDGLRPFTVQRSPFADQP